MDYMKSASIWLSRTSAAERLVFSKAMP